MTDDDTFDEDEVHSGPCERSASSSSERLDREAEERTCIGPDCLNPHYDHMRWECFTAESAEADHAEDDVGADARQENEP